MPAATMLRSLIVMPAITPMLLPELIGHALTPVNPIETVALSADEFEIVRFLLPHVPVSKIRCFPLLLAMRRGKHGSRMKSLLSEPYRDGHHARH
jgi:hypothetical protein